MAADPGWFRTLIERAPDGIVVCRGGVVVYANATATRLLAGSGEAPVGRRFVALCAPGPHVQKLETALAANCWIEQRMIDVELNGDGETRPIAAMSGAQISDDTGTLVEIVMRDVTAIRAAERAVRQNEERLTLAFAGAEEGVWDWDLATGAVYYSPRWKEMLGYDADEIEPHLRAWERLLHPGDKPRAEALNEQVLQGGQRYEGEFRLRHKAGHYIDVLTRGYPIRCGDDGPIVRIVGTHLDLTDRKRAEERLRESEERLTLAFAGAQEGVWDWNLETGAVVYSARWKEMLGYDEDEIEPHVSAWERLLHPEDMPRAREVNEGVVRGERPYEGEFRLRHKDGHYVHVLSRGYPVRRVPGGPVVRIVGTHFDLTERKQAEAERARTELLGRLVFAQEDERRRIAREMHDQFGEQLTALGHGIGRLKQACADAPALAAHVDGLEAISQRLDRDVDQLVWELRPTALDDLGLRAALGNYVNDWSARVGISAAVHTTGLDDQRLPSEIETALYRIAQEALTNVAKHARAAKVEVILERRRDHVLLIVEDDGVGFEPGEATSRRGFGLLGMHERAALVGATLDIESSAGQGTTVLVRMAATPAERSTASHA